MGEYSAGVTGELDSYVWSWSIDCVEFDAVVMAVGCDGVASGYVT